MHGCSVAVRRRHPTAIRSPGRTLLGCSLVTVLPAPDVCVGLACSLCALACAVGATIGSCVSMYARLDFFTCTYRTSYRLPSSCTALLRCTFSPEIQITVEWTGSTACIYATPLVVCFAVFCDTVYAVTVLADLLRTGNWDYCFAFFTVICYSCNVVLYSTRYSVVGSRYTATNRYTVG